MRVLFILSFLWVSSCLAQTHRTPPSVYVALGDSFAAGNGAGDPEASSDTNFCSRSRNAYPTLFASRGAQVPFFRSVACSAVGKHAVLNQVSAIPPNAELVSVTTGMEFITMASVVYSCDELYDKPACAGEGGALALAETEAQAPFYAYLKDLIAAIQSRAPLALIVILGYPRWYGSPVKDCKPHTGAPGADVGDIKDRINALPLTLQLQAYAAVDSSERVVYRNVDQAFSWHRYCDGEHNQWLVNYMQINLERSGWRDYGYFHPTKNGHSAYADALQDAWDLAG